MTKTTRGPAGLCIHWTSGSTVPAGVTPKAAAGFENIGESTSTTGFEKVVVFQMLVCFRCHWTSEYGGETLFPLEIWGFAVDCIERQSFQFADIALKA